MMIEPGIYFGNVDICFDEPKGIVHTDLFNIQFELNFDTMIITRCDTKETKPFAYCDGTASFESFKLG